MSDFWAYDGTTWRNITAPWAYDGTTWRELTEAWSYDGAVWRKVFEGVSCTVPTCDSGVSVWTEAGCTEMNECQYCIGVNTTNCTDPCHNIDGFLSQNGGSFNAAIFTCASKGCTDQTGTDCSAEMDCNLTRTGTRCKDNTDDWQGRLTVEDDSDGTDRCSYTGSTFTGACIA